MAYLGYTIKVPEAALMPFRHDSVKEILWAHRLGASLYDDQRLPGVTPLKIAEGWRYEVRDKKGRLLDVRVIESYTKQGTPVFAYRPPQEGDYYIKFRDGTYDVMERGLKDWYIRRWKEQQQKRVEASDEYKALKEQILNNN